MRNSIGIKAICVIFLIIITFLLCSCNNEEAQDWELAVSENTLESYNSFLEKWSDSKNVGRIITAKDEIAWLEANITKTSEGFREYSANHNKYKEEVGGLYYDCEAWESLRQRVLYNNGKFNYSYSDRLDDINDYLNEHPDGLFVEEARDMIAYHENLFDIVSTLQPVMSGNGINSAGDYDPDLPAKDNKIVILHHSYLPIERNLDLPKKLIPFSVEEVTLVIVLIDEPKRITLETAQYSDGKTYSRSQEERNLELREAKTGELIKSGRIVSAEPKYFPGVIFENDVFVLNTDLEYPKDIIDWFYTALDPQLSLPGW